jgi:hypothetical protein
VIDIEGLLVARHTAVHTSKTPSSEGRRSLLLGRRTLLSKRVDFGHRRGDGSVSCSRTRLDGSRTRDCSMFRSWVRCRCRRPSPRGGGSRTVRCSSLSTVDNSSTNDGQQHDEGANELTRHSGVIRHTRPIPEPMRRLLEDAGAFAVPAATSRSEDDVERVRGWVENGPGEVVLVHHAGPVRAASCRADRITRESAGFAEYAS